MGGLWETPRGRPNRQGKGEKIVQDIDRSELLSGHLLLAELIWVLDQVLPAILLVCCGLASIWVESGAGSLLTAMRIQTEWCLHHLCTVPGVQW